MLPLFRSPTCLHLACALPSVLRLVRHSFADNVQQWQSKATKELKGKDPLQTLTYNTADVRVRWATAAALGMTTSQFVTYFVAGHCSEAGVHSTGSGGTGPCYR